MSFIFTCPFCNQKLDCDETLENQVTKCPSCGNEIVPVRPELSEPEAKPKIQVNPIANESNKIETTCPHCGSRFEVDKSYLNQQATCPSCKKFFVISNDHPILKPIGKKPVNRLINDPKQKKDILFFWIAFPGFYFLLAMICLGATPYMKSGHIFLLIVIILVLIFATKVVVTAETGMKRWQELVPFLSLLFILFPIGYIVYADMRKQCGLSNITPWAVLTSIPIGLILVIKIGMLF